jgi:UDP-N-acetyl-D-galactosamine dehydrogenase
MNHKIAVVGLGYVGLPLAIEFSKKYTTLGFDTSKNRVKELIDGTERTGEISNSILEERLQDGLIITDNPDSLAQFNIYIITVPTPVTESKEPNLDFLKQASTTVANYLKKDDIVIYESTVYPGCTEEFCVPILEENSKLKYNKDFYCGYSPERINPGDKKNTLTNIKKVTSGSDKKTSVIVDNLYKSIIDAGTHLTSSIKIAEATKAIENAQRDLNISFMNELALIFDLMDIDTNEVIDAASTKWNFLKFRPGIVGGHCISVDPYYLVHKAKTLGYEPEVILSGRRVNDKMGTFVGEKVLKLMEDNAIEIKNSHALILGITFKENMSDIRNSKVIDIYNILNMNGLKIDVYDPHADKEEVKSEFKIEMVENLQKYDSIIVAVAHDEFKKLNFKSLKKSDNSIIYDIKGFLKKSEINGRL